jgi:hypothetical protein
MKTEVEVGNSTTLRPWVVVRMRARGNGERATARVNASPAVVSGKELLAAIIETHFGKSQPAIVSPVSQLIALMFALVSPVCRGLAGPYNALSLASAKYILAHSVQVFPNPHPLAASSSLALHGVPFSAQPDCLLMVYQCTLYTRATPSSLLSPLLYFQLNLRSFAVLLALRVVGCSDVRRVHAEPGGGGLFILLLVLDLPQQPGLHLLVILGLPPPPRGLREPQQYGGGAAS